MITNNTDYSIQRLRGLSTDTKPVNVPNGSEFREMDTGKKFLFSEAGTEWIEQPGSGGSGGSGGGGTMKVSFTGSTDEITADKTYTEVFTAIQNGDNVYAVNLPTPDIYQLWRVGATLVGKFIEFSRVVVNPGNFVQQTVLRIDSDNVCSLDILNYQGVNSGK